MNASWFGSTLRAGNWGMIRATVTNPSSEVRAGTVLFTIDQQAHVQFGRAVWVPPKSSRTVWLPIRAETITNASKPQNCSVQWVEQVNGVERQWARAVALVPATEDPSTVAALRGLETDDALGNAATAMRRALSNNQRVISIAPDRLPAIAEGWQGIDLLVISHIPDSVDQLQRQALRQWLVGGGRLWVVLGDQPASGLDKLLGDAWTVQEVGRTKLFKATIENQREKFDLSWTEPVSMVRVLAPGAEVVQRVNGWPATLQFNVGRGLVLVSTLGPRAWFNDKGAPVKPLEQDITQILGRMPTRATLPADEYSHLLTQQIGGRIVSRGTVLVVLGGLCVLLVGLSITLALRHRLELFSAYGSGLAVLAALVMIGAGMAQRGGIPVTFSEAEIVQADPATRTTSGSGMLNIYNPTAKGEAGALRSNSAGLAWPDSLRPAASPARLIWTDQDQWQWHNLPLPSGTVLGAATWRGASVPSLTWPVLRLDKSSATIELPPQWNNVTDDAMIASVLGTYSLNRQSARTFTMDLTQPMSRGELVRSGVLTDEQRNCQNVTRAMMRRPAIFSQPSLLVWSGPGDEGFGMADTDYSHRRLGLTIVPMLVLGPSDGGSFVIPAGLIPFSSVRVAGGSSSTLFNPQTREWIQQQQNPSRVGLRFDLPKSLLPIKVESGRMALRITAPGRTVTVSLPNQKPNDKPLASIVSPTRDAVLELPGESLVPDSQGSITLVLTVGDAEKVDASWRVEGLELSLTANASRP